ncbi:binding partner of ACD11 1-like [Rutidosis leptorrhynchoides]|uniref:binding partner of ACD11 1-like n=1 Tax=Rutidosis leptorrhynchoides TaxID=125765 RepID=UPI003A99EFB2
MASTESKTETDVPPPNAPKETVNVAEVTASTEPKTETCVPPTSTEPKDETDVPPTDVPEVKQIKTVEVSSITTNVTEKDIWEFFSFSGNIHYIEIKSESETTKLAFVTFKETQGANTAVLLTGATIGELPVSVRHVENYQLPPEAPPLTQIGSPSAESVGEVAQKAEEVVSTMLAKGFVLGKDALQKAKSFDEKHKLTTNTSATVASIDRKMGLTQKFNMGTAAVNEKMKEVDERYQVTEATKSAISKAEKKANTAGSALMSNPYVNSGAVWVSGAFAAFVKAVDSVGSKTKKKVKKAEEEKEGSKTKEDEPKTNKEVQEVVEKNDGSKTELKIEAEEKDGSKTKAKAEEEIDGSKTKGKVHTDESSNKDSSVISDKPSN